MKRSANKRKSRTPSHWHDVKGKVIGCRLPDALHAQVTQAAAKLGVPNGVFLRIAAQDKVNALKEKK